MERVERMLIVDGLNTFVRNWAVVPSMNVNGDPNGGVVGFIRSLKFIMKNVKPTRVIVAWDGEGGSAKRRSVYSEYKAGRKPKVNRQYDFESAEESHVNMRTQYAKLRELLDCLGVTQIEVHSVEADDVIGFLCRHVYPRTQKVLLSSDKDFFQLVDPWTIIYSPSKKKYYTSSDLKDEYHVLPENFILIKAMKGDGSDNIKGVGGIAEKTAVKLFPFLSDRPSTLADIFRHAEENRAKSPKYERVLANKDVLIGNIDLMQLIVPIISAQSVRIIRTAVEVGGGRVNVSEFKLKLLRDGIQITDADLFSVFQEYWSRM